jgi:ribosomal protein S18 acetylase RimI-like enzyme
MNMIDGFEITRAAAADQELVDAMAHLIRQLSKTSPLPTAAELQETIDSSCMTLLIARDRSGKIFGTLALAVFRIPTGVRAWIEDVVVDNSRRGRGIGEALTREALRIARERGARTVELTSRPSKEAANRLYRRLGFVARETNVYRYPIEKEIYATEAAGTSAPRDAKKS